MKYIMKSRVLSAYEDNKAVARIKSSFLDSRKTIFLRENHEQYQTDIDLSNVPEDKKGDVRFRVYTLRNQNGDVLMEAHPGYAENDDPDEVGWSVCRAQKVDHADVLLNGANWLLIMHNSQNYSLKNKDDTVILQIMHNGISGGWTISTGENFPPQVICGLFIFCRYIEQENEFIIV